MTTQTAREAERRRHWDRRYAEAESNALRASAVLEKTTGPDFPDVAANLQLLGRIRSAQGRYEEAEPLLKRSLDIKNGFINHNPSVSAGATSRK